MQLLSKLIVVLSLFITGCGEELLVRDLSQRDANKVSALLFRAGLSASVVHEGAGHDGYQVFVPSRILPKAILLLDNSKGSFSYSSDSFDSLVAKKGILPSSPEMEQLRVERALSLQLQELLSGIDGIEAVSAVVKLEDGKVSTASIVYTSNSKEGNSPDAIKRIAQTIFPHLSDDKIAVHVIVGVPATAAINEVGAVAGQLEMVVPLSFFLNSVRVATADMTMLAIVLIGLLLIVGVLFALIGFMIGRRFELFYRNKAKR